LLTSKEERQYKRTCLLTRKEAVQKYLLTSKEAAQKYLLTTLQVMLETLAACLGKGESEEPSKKMRCFNGHMLGCLIKSMPR